MPNNHRNGSTIQTIVTLDTTQAPARIFHLRLRPFPTIRFDPTHHTLQREVMLERMQTILRTTVTRSRIDNETLLGLSPDTPTNILLNDWYARFAANPLQTARQRYIAAIDLEWLLYEQIEPDDQLRLHIQVREIDVLINLLLPALPSGPLTLDQFRTRYRERADQLLRAEMTRQTLAQYQAFIEELLYQTGLTAADMLHTERERVRQQIQNTTQVLQATTTTVHEQINQAANSSDSARQTLLREYSFFKQIQALHHDTLHQMAATLQTAPHE